jgi:ATP phosphoribosyltransferase
VTAPALTIAVPRGALFGETLDLLDAIGIETAEVRSNDRKLLFAGSGIVTMRPSDVPTYVEAGAADLGITGKDVLAEQAERDVYELLDLGYGPCRMVLASVEGDPDPATESLRRLGVMRVATKYPRTAARYFEETGRQAEIVEVKGSVELAPLTGLVEAIVDLTATGTTLRENGLVIREEIGPSTARLIANPAAHRLKAAEIDRLLDRIRGAVAA